MSEEKTKTDGLKLPTTITATYKIITPMFIGDAEQQATAISPQSFKGALRFWWRALAWGRIRQDALLDPKVQEKPDDKNLTEERREKAIDAAALTKLHHQEAVLFGSSATKPKPDSNDIYGKGCVAIKINREELGATKANSVHEKLKEHDAARYLGYGVVGAFGANSGKLTRDCINENQEFKVTILVDEKRFQEKNKKIEENEKTVSSEDNVTNPTADKQIIDALKILGLLGGLGSKVRKGFGSVNLISLSNSKDETEKGSPPNTIVEYQSAIQGLLENMDKYDLPPFSAFTSQTVIIKTFKRDCPYKVLGAYGKSMIEYRSWGRDAKISRFDEDGIRHKPWEKEDSEKKFEADHHWSKGQNYFEQRLPEEIFANFHPKRVMFGLPHNYRKIQVGRDLGKTDNGQDKYGRRASPLFFHIQEINGQYYGIATVLKSQFLPEDDKIKAGRNSVPQHIEWDVLIENFLKGKVKQNSNNTDKLRFPNAEVIFPKEQ